MPTPSDTGNMGLNVLMSSKWPANDWNGPEKVVSEDTGVVGRRTIDQVTEEGIGYEMVILRGAKHLVPVAKQVSFEETWGRERKRVEENN